jgi:preprotein translocase subunit SecD
MNRYPLWKNLLVILVVALGVVYAAPNVFGEIPAVQISATRTTQVDAALATRLERVLAEGGIAHRGITRGERDLVVRFDDPESQLKARDLIQRQLGDGYTVALNLLPATPAWLRALGARPMYLGLDLRGGVHFLLEVDTRAVLRKAEESFADDMRRILREGRIRYLSVRRLEGGGIEARFREAAERARALEPLRRELPELVFSESAATTGGEFLLIGRLKPEALAQKKRFALEQNITALSNRVNELGVAEPIIQQQGEDRIVVQLPGVQDTAKAKEILGRTATLEFMLVDEEHDLAAALAGQVPPGSKLYKMRDGRPILLKNRVIYSGDNIVDAAPGFDSVSGRPIVSITLDARGAAINQRVTGENVGKRMAAVYIEIRTEPQFDEQGRPVLDERGNPVRVSRRIEEVITAPVIRSQLGKRFQIEGLDSVEEATELALLLRAGSLSAPVYIAEERTVGPSLGADNIDQGVKAALLGAALVLAFMAIYYRVFGLIADLALIVNLVLLLAIMSLLQATLTLPGIAGIVLTLGMAVDANVLIFERIREELRNGNSPQASIHAGFERAWATILDSNLTTLIAALVLFNFGTGPVKGFAVTLSIGILTSMFTAVLFTRAVINALYGGRRLQSVPV